MNHPAHVAFRSLAAGALAAAGVISILASGGGGGSFEGATGAQGLWSGTTDAGRTMSGVVLDDGSYWFLYDIPGIDHPLEIDGLIQGTGSTSGNDFASSDGLDFTFEGFFTDTDFDGSFAVQSTLDGTFTTSGSSQVFNASYDSAYEQVPALADIAGTYDGSSINVPAGGTPRSAQFVIGAPGTLAVAGLAGCNDFQATIVPHAAGNVYDVSGTISAVDCVPGATRDVNGVAFFDALTGTIYVLAVDSGRTHSYFLTGTRQ